MLGLKDFVHLPELDAVMAQIAAETRGLVLVTGLDPRTITAPFAEHGILPSGLSAFFGILLREWLGVDRARKAIVISENDESIRVPRQFKRQVEYITIKPPLTYEAALDAATQRRNALVVVEHLTPEIAPHVFQIAQREMRVLSQVDTLLRGTRVKRQLGNWGATPEQLDALAWVIAVQRLATLCEACKQRDELDPARRAEICLRYPKLPPDGIFFREGRCAECQYTGRRGDVAVFDIYHAPADSADGALSLEEYVQGLVAQGQLSLDDLILLEANQMERAFRLLSAREEALIQTNAALQSKVAELQVANRVSEQRTAQLFSLEEIGHALTTLTDLHQLANYVTRKAGELCEADRVICYHLRPDGTAQVLAVQGWDESLLYKRFEAARVLADLPTENTPPQPFSGYPPGIPRRHQDIEGVALRAGLRVPLIAQHEVVGLLIFHSTRKRRFQPGEVALLQAFANQSALAIQRAGLIEALKEKITALEKAQAEIAKKERLERELELAREVQESMLPKIFPLVPGFTFAARSEPARQVGGDLYDVFLLDNNRVGIIIGDVSDKGMPAALFMALTRSLVVAEARREASPLRVLNRVHHLLLEFATRNMFVTLFYGVIDARTRKMTFVRAGHDRPLLLRRDALEPLEGEGSVLGLLDAEEIYRDEIEIKLEGGDRLILYTDGLIDAMDVSGRPFDLGRLKHLIQAKSELPPESMCHAIFDELAQYQRGAEQYDDMTLLVVEVK